MKRICVFCGSNAGHHPAYGAEAEKLGRLRTRDYTGWQLAFLITKPA
jgi:predicted Rossmann-fold nucleotide-binding protein